MTHYAHIHNEARYEAAIARRIKANRAKTGRAKWFAAHEDAQTLNDWLFGCGEFEDKFERDPRCTEYDDGVIDHCFEIDGEDYRCSCKRVVHPLRAFARGDFCDSLRDAIDNWGGLTDGQHAALAKSFAKAQELLAGREERRAAERAADALTSHVGTVGERIELRVTCERVHHFEGQFGTTYINICRDADNNVIVYKGSNRLYKGRTYAGKATIKAHDLRDGVPQTIIARPKFEEIEV